MAQSGHAAGIDVPMVIAGAGPVGLLTSILLSQQGVRSVVLEKCLPFLSLPKAPVVRLPHGVQHSPPPAR
jgi:2-polyprenyl-6-methoxyphenol hydroxylase-like FAD-dependent oxidoreductase